LEKIRKGLKVSQVAKFFFLIPIFTAKIENFADLIEKSKLRLDLHFTLILSKAIDAFFKKLPKTLDHIKLSLNSNNEFTDFNLFFQDEITRYIV